MLSVSQNGNNDCFLLRGKSDMYTKVEFLQVKKLFGSVNQN